MHLSRTTFLGMRTASCILLILFLLGASHVMPAAEREGCSVCGMYLDLYARTLFVISLDDGSIRSACSLACAARIMNEDNAHVKDVKVANFLTGELIDARSAFFLEGSDVPGVMSSTSRVAFSSQKAARDFRKRHGGRIVTFDEAVRDQLKELE
jgi:copper chaperone NosL